MSGLDEQLNGFLSQVKKLVPDTQTRSEMTKAGAKVYADSLKQSAPRSKHNDVKYKHLQDDIVTQNTDIDGEKNGNSTVGFGKKAHIARFLNDGTKKMQATHFVDNSRKESEEAVFTAQKDIYNRRLKGDR